ncbi:MAG: lytic transglycosylase domain-containing protein [Chloroflexota bacterium]|jgi:soluble lytic murein transglycosylase-like protein
MFNDNLGMTGLQSLYYQLLVKLLEKYNANLNKKSSQPIENTLGGSFAEIISEVSKRYNVDPHLVQAVVKAESNFDPKAQSSAGATGLMQLMPGTAADLGVSNAYDPKQNIEGGVRYLRMLLDRYQGDISKALAGYNAGPGAVDQYNGVPPYAETQTYVNRVLNYYDNYSDDGTSEHTWRA